MTEIRIVLSVFDIPTNMHKLYHVYPLISRERSDTFNSNADYSRNLSAIVCPYLRLCIGGCCSIVLRKRTMTMLYVSYCSRKIGKEEEN